jgi:hypothetical protein
MLAVAMEYARVPVAKLDFLGDCNEKARSCIGSCRVITLRLPAYVCADINTVYKTGVFIFSSRRKILAGHSMVHSGP